MTSRVLLADYHDRAHASAITSLLREHAEAILGTTYGSFTVSERLIPELARRPFAFSVIAFADECPAGLANCFEGFSTFSCRPIINIHDFMVSQPFRRRGLSGELLRVIEEIATSRGCSKLTLEVPAFNDAAKQAYLKFGFSDQTLSDEGGQALFWEKIL